MNDLRTKFKVACLFLLFLYLFNFSANASDIVKNGNFEFALDEIEQSGWNISPTTQKNSITIDKNISHSGRSSIFLSGKVDAVTELAQFIDPSNLKSHNVRFNIFVKSEAFDADSKFFIYAAGIGSLKGRIIFNKNIAKIVYLNNGWINISCFGYVENDVTKVAFGLKLVGHGKIWVDDVSADVLPDRAPVSESASENINYVFELVKNNSVNRSKIDWDRLRSDIYIRSSGAASLEDSYSPLNFLLRSLGDNHSYFRYDDAVIPGDSKINLPSGKMIQKNIAYISLPSFSDLNRDKMKEYVASAASIILTLERYEPAGWVVDLRDNTGGNMWPMLAGIGSMLGEGTLGNFVYPNGAIQSWSYSLALNNIGLKISEYPLPKSKDLLSKPVAILIDGHTASSGEAVLIAFKGRDNTRSFGAPTAGVPTANVTHVLPDGTRMNLTEAYMSDRNGVIYEGPIQAEQPLSTSKLENFDTDSYIVSSVEWITNYKH